MLFMSLTAIKNYLIELHCKNLIKIHLINIAVICNIYFYSRIIDVSDMLFLI
jgi:hypothetical protein